MGIKQLNSFLQAECAQHIHHTTLEVASNKTIVVDTSIYMYEFCRNGDLIEGFQMLIDLYKEHHITPIFIFDGQMPVEKKRVIKERAEVRHRAVKELALVTTQLNEMPDEDPNKPVILTRQSELVAQTVSLSSEQPKQLQEWFKARQIAFQVAEGEADILCAKMVFSGKAWGCMSNDTDMFLYCCPNILSKVEIKGEHRGKCLYYCLDEILVQLNMDMYSFIQMLVLAGSEYTPHFKQINIYKIYRKWSMYLSYRQQFYEKWHGPVIPFYLWYQRYLKLETESDIHSYAEHIKAYQKVTVLIKDMIKGHAVL
jgi:5'-3' exonuclease